ncbi:MAG: PAS domain S-box protein [Spirochaetes bacterium]|nr:PAS domain S-box protein [Spirochaetota bacterium]
MEERKRIIYIILIMSALVLCGSIFSNILLYKTSIEETRIHLADAAKLLAHLLEPRPYPGRDGGAEAWPAGQVIPSTEGIVDAIRNYERHKRKMELTIAFLDKDKIRFIAALRHYGRAEHPKTIGIYSGLAEPMRRALEGKSGTMTGKDYHGRTVLAAYEHITGRNMGVVAKIDMAEFRAPYIRSGIIIVAVSLLIILAGVIAIGRISNPIMNNLENQVEALAASNEELDAVNEELQASMEEMERTNNDLYRSQFELAMSEARFRTLIENSSVGVIAADLENRRFVFANPSACAMFGYECEEMLARGVDDIHPAEDLERIHGEFSALMEKKYQISRELPCRRKDGSVFYADIAAMPIIIDDLKCLLGQFIDVTERKRGEEALRESEERFSKIFHLSPMSIALSGAHDGRYIDVNDEFLALTGYAREEVIGRSSDDLGLWIESGQERRIHEEINRGATVHDCQIEIRNKGGAILTVLYSAVPVTIRGMPCIIKSAIDITDRRRAEEALRESEERYRRITESITDYIFTVAIEGGRPVGTVHGSACLAVTGYTARELNDDPYLWINMVHADDRQAVREQVEDLLKENRPWPIEHRIYRKDGAVRWVRNTPVPYHDAAGRLYAYDGIIVDITERREAVEALRESEEKFAKAFMNAPVLMSITSVEDGTIIDVNSQFVEQSGFTREELIGRKTLDTGYVRLEDREHYTEIVRKYGIASGVDLTVYPREGGPRQVIFCGDHITIGGKKRLLSIAVDITDWKKAEKDLRDSEDKYRRLFTEISSGFALHEMILDDRGNPVDYRFIEVNPAFENLTGLRDVIGKTVREVIPGIDSFWIESYGRVVRSGTAEVFENYVEQLDRWYETRAYPRGGNMFVAIFNDITDRKRAEKALLEKTEELNRYFNVNLDLLCIANTEGYFLRINPEWENALGYRLEDLEGRRFLDFVHPDDLAGTLAATADLSRKKDVLNFINRYRRIDGTYRWIEWRSASPDGIHIYAAARDITEQYRVSGELRREKETAQKYLDIAGVMFVAIDDDQRVSLINRKGCEILGYSYEEIMGKKWFDTFVHERIREEMKDVFNRLIKGDISPVEYYENSVVTASGEERLIAWHNTVIKDASGAITGTLSSGEDITEKKKSEDDLHGQLAINMALAGISGSIISRSYSISETAYMVLEYARLLSDSDHGFVSEIDPDTGDGIGIALTGMFGPPPINGVQRPVLVKRGADGRYPGLIGHSLNTRREFFTNDPGSHPASGEDAGGIPRFSRLLSVPVVYGGDLVGQIALADSARDYTEDDLKMARRLGSIYAMAVVRLRNDAMLLKSLEEKTVLIKELHHRVKNNMQVVSSLISLQARKIDDDRYRGIFMESSNRIQAMAMVHEKIYHSDDLARVDFSRYVREIAERLLYSFSLERQQVALEFDVRDVYLGIDQAIPCGIILNELITNSFKHAFPKGRRGTLSISFVAEGDGRHRLVVQDDGPGIPDDLISSAEKSLGMQIVTALTRQLNGTIAAGNAGGARIEIVF